MLQEINEFKHIEFVAYSKNPIFFFIPTTSSKIDKTSICLLMYTSFSKHHENLFTEKENSLPSG